MSLVQHKAASDFTTEELRRRAEGVLRPPAEITASADDTPVPNSDFKLNPGLEKLSVSLEKRPAAVLVPVINSPDGASVILTTRTDDLPTHAGQISFPGGKMEETDSSLAETALREAHEEIGLDEKYVESIGFLEDYMTSTGYRISPLVALIREGYSLKPDESEVADVFDVPLSFLMDSSNHELHTREWRGAQRLFYAMPYNDRFIWGATAGMLRNMYETLYSPGARP